MERHIDAPLRAALASFAFAAAAIHFAMAPSHLLEWQKAGVAFLLAGWLQAVVAVLILVRPSRFVWVAAVVLSAGLMGVWAVSRATGLPFGPEKGEPEPATVVDLVAVGLEAALVAGALLVLSGRRPRLSRVGVLPSAVPLVAFALAAGALASPSARDHARHGEHDRPDSHAPGFDAIRHTHGAAARFPLDDATRRELNRQLALTRKAAARHPTVADAIRDGYRRTDRYQPGVGIHFSKEDAGFDADGVMDDRALLHPTSLLYLSADPDSPVVGLMYVTRTDVEPEGFAGRNDGWHLHEDVCITRGSGGSIETVPSATGRPAACAARGGRIPKPLWMLHVWTVPGFDAGEDGVFAGVNPKLGCSDGTYETVPVSELPPGGLNHCRSGASKVL